MDLFVEIYREGKRSKRLFILKNMLFIILPLFFIIYWIYSPDSDNSLLITSSVAWITGLVIGILKLPKVGIFFGCALGLIIGLYYFDLISVYGGFIFGLYGGSLAGLAFIYREIWKRSIYLATIGVIITFVSYFFIDGFWSIPITIIALSFIFITLISSAIIPDKGWILGISISIVLGNYIFDVIQKYRLNIQNTDIFARTAFAGMGALTILLLIGLIGMVIPLFNLKYLSGKKLTFTKVLILGLGYIGGLGAVYLNFEYKYILAINSQNELIFWIITVGFITFLSGIYSIMLENSSLRKVFICRREYQKNITIYNKLLRSNIELYYYMMTKTHKRKMRNKYKKVFGNIKQLFFKAVREKNKNNLGKSINYLNRAQKLLWKFDKNRG